MNVRTGLWMLIAGSVGTMLIAARPPEPRQPPPAKPHRAERPWLTHDAMRELVGEGGVPGPLFAGLTLGGSAPTALDRARIEAWASRNQVEINFEVAGDELRAIRFSVEFGGCCGYEGADTLASQMARIHVGGGCMNDEHWVNNWGTVVDGIAIRGHVHVNRVEARWERELSIAELLDRADHLLGQTRAQLRASEGDRLRELEPGTTYLLDQPYPFDDQFTARHNGIELTLEHGVITDVSFNALDWNRLNNEAQEELESTLAKRWGRPATSATYMKTWEKRDRSISADTTPWEPLIKITRRKDHDAS